MEWEEYSQTRSAYGQDTPNFRTFLELEKNDPHGETEWNTCLINLALPGMVSQPVTPTLRKRDMRMTTNSKTSLGNREGSKPAIATDFQTPAPNEVSLLICPF